MIQTLEQPVIRGVRFFLAHTPGLVRYGSKPSRDLTRDATMAEAIASHLRTYEAAVAYPPNRAFLGHIHPDMLASISQPWFASAAPGTRWGAHGEIMPEEEFYGILKICDAFDLVHLEAGFVEEARAALATHPVLTPADLEPHWLHASGPRGRLLAGGGCAAGKPHLQGLGGDGHAHPAGPGTARSS